MRQIVRNLQGLSLTDARRIARQLIFADGALNADDLPQLAKLKFELLNRSGHLHYEYDTARFDEVLLQVHGHRTRLRQLSHVVDHGLQVDLAGVALGSGLTEGEEVVPAAGQERVRRHRVGRSELDRLAVERRVTVPPSSEKPDRLRPIVIILYVAVNKV